MSKFAHINSREGFTRSLLSLIILILAVIVSCQNEKPKTFSFAPSEKYFFDHLDSATIYLESLGQKIESQDTTNIWDDFNNARRHFKNIEFILAFTEQENYKSLNAPNILKVLEEDATGVKVLTPFGFQVIEEGLTELDFSKPEETQALSSKLKKTLARIKVIHTNIDLRHIKEYHFAWMIRDNFVRIATMGITGFDSPVQTQSLTESIWNLDGVKSNLLFYKAQFNDPQLYQKLMIQIEQTQLNLKEDFDHFDRFNYWKLDLNQQVSLWNQWVKDWKIEFPFELALQNNFDYLNSAEAFNLERFGDPKRGKPTQAKAFIGQVLFNDKQLSKAGDLSCATCHNPQRAFTDTFKVRPGIKRNSPTLLYSALQKGFFYDSRAGSLEDQVVGVFKNHAEFNTSETEILAKISADSNYVKLFKEAYGEAPNPILLRNSLASFVKTLIPFQSKFDQSLKGLDSLSDDERSGFNLFMGKASCATCHFPPLFNGTVPPYFRESELENIGTPEPGTDSLVISQDLGRYDFFKTEERKHFFKTPTVRNSDLTAPYMHNGVIHTLKEVIEFYNHGGGIGMGMDNPLQTLPFDSLQLNNEEVDQIQQFLKTLNDPI